MIEQTDVLFFSQVDAQDVQEERDQQRDRKSSLPFLVSRPDFPLARRKQGPRASVLTIVTWKSFGSRSKNRPNYEPSALADPGDRLDRFADKGKSRGV